jgi:ABC-type transport system involved in multi-copper enzyme maturation permease subunit
MAERFGLGPVFAYEWLTRSRRWQGYALRGLFVLALLVGLSLVWKSVTANDYQTSRQQLARAGESFYVTMTITEIALILLAAPASTAGAICLDKSRGTLAHVMVTDLTDHEVVLGKLAARLVPILNLVACALPVTALGTLLGGIDPMGLTGSVLIVAGVALVGCSLALMLSIWASKAHEVMFGVFGCWLLWLLPYSIWYLLRVTFGPPPRWLEASNPFWLALAPQNAPNTTSMLEPVLFFAGCLVASVLMAALSVAKVRPVYLRQANLVPKEIVDSRSEAWFRNEVRWWPGPSLDTNPVLWREWRRNRPSRLIQIVWRLYVAVVSMVSLYLIWDGWSREGRVSGPAMAPLFNGFQVSIGLLFLAASAGTVLSEERTRGSLDVLLTTPLSTRSIVWGKWWAAYRQVLWLAFWPLVMAYAFLRIGSDLWLTSLLYFIPILILVQGAALTSLGLALATWISRTGLVVTWTLAGVVASVFGWPVVDYLKNHAETSLGMGSPFLNIIMPMDLLEQGGGYGLMDAGPESLWKVLASWSAIYAAMAGILYLATLLTFERCLGRSPERRRRPAEPTFTSLDSRIRPVGGRPATDAVNSSPRPR